MCLRVIDSCFIKIAAVELIQSDVTQRILGASMEVHKFLGNGYQEVFYQRALALEFRSMNIRYEREVEQMVYYKEPDQLIGTRRADFLVEGKVLVELKAVKELEFIHEAQLLNYLKAYRLEVGLLINFGGPSLTWKRRVLTNHR